MELEHGKIEREIDIAASPATVFDVITSPDHLREWWPDDAIVEPRAGAVGELVFGDRSSPEAQIPQITVVEAVPAQRFSFRWIYPEGEDAHDGNSLLVTFDLVARGDGTRLRMTETGFREKGWEVAVLEQQYREHAESWDHFLPRLVAYAPTVGVAS
jgi:uncharacterized protein YndB with AHSA1/START domain